MEAFDHGDYDAARPGLERATALYAAASEVARSDASLYEAAAQAWLQRAENDFRQRRSPRESLQHALDIIDDRALRVDPDDPPAYTTRSYVLLRWYLTPLLAGQGDQRPLLEQMAQAARRAVEIDPQDAHAWTSLGKAHVYRGRYELDNGGQGEPWWNGALEEFGKALAIQPNDVLAHNLLGTAHRWLGSGIDKSGGDPTPEYRAALRSYERANAIDPKYLVACANQVDLYTVMAEYNDTVGTDPRPAVDGARRAGERCLALDPNFYVVLDNLAQAQLALASYLVETGSDPMGALVSARGYIDRAEKVQFENMRVWFRRLVAASTEATFLLHQGADPTRAIAAGRAALKEALRLRPDSANFYVEAARLDLVEAGWAAHAANGEALLLSDALADAKRAVALDGHLAVAKLTAAEVCLQIATAQPSRAVADAGIAYADQALGLSPRLVKAQTVRAALSRLRAP
jgi:tetratricopeptide (TPR) repeat protein